MLHVPVVPDLRRAKKKQLQIPVKAVDWSLAQLNKFLLSKNHDDLDSKVGTHHALLSHYYDTRGTSKKY
jgi:hypothetical protein